MAYRCKLPHGPQKRYQAKLEEAVKGEARALGQRQRTEDLELQVSGEMLAACQDCKPVPFASRSASRVESLPPAMA